MTRTRRALVALLGWLFLGSAAGLAQSERTADPADVSKTVAAATTYRLLLTDTEDLPGGGMRVKGIDRWSPTQNMRLVGRADIQGYLEVGDVVTHVNGQPIAGVADCRQAVELSGGEPVALKVWDRRTGQSFDWWVAPAAIPVPLGPPPGARAGDPRVHAVLVGDTLDSKIGDAVRVDIARWLALLGDGHRIHPSRVGTVVTLIGRDCTPDKIIAAVRALPSGPNDTVLCYCSSHGAYDARFETADRVSGGHFLALSKRGRRDLMHQALRENVYAKPGRLQVVITDSCNTRGDARLVPPPAPGGWGGAAPVAKRVTTVEELLLCHAGRLDMNAARRGEAAVCRVSGSVFTVALTEAMNGSADWKDVWAVAAKQTKDDGDHHPVAFDFQVRRDPSIRLLPLIER